MSILDELKKKLIDVLTEMKEIKPVQFLDIDCDNQTFNFSGVSVDEVDNRLYIEIAMYHDNLPVHASNPIKDAAGRPILPENRKGSAFNAASIMGGD